MTQDHLRSIDHISLAVWKAKTEGEAAIRTYFHERMDRAARRRFNQFLVDMEDDLARMASPPEHRFVERCLRMLRNLEQGFGPWGARE